MIEAKFAILHTEPFVDLSAAKAAIGTSVSSEKASTP